MSTPLNPLGKFVGYEIKHVLLAFSNTESACNFLGTNSTIGDFSSLKKNNVDKDNSVGTELKVSCGRAFIVINELFDTAFTIASLNWNFDFYSPVASNSTSCVGNLFVSATSSESKIFLNLVRNISNDLDVAIPHITFVLYTFFRGQTSATNPNNTTLPSKPLIFSVLDAGTSVADDDNLAMFNFVAHYNTLAQMPQFSTLSQMTITRDGGGLDNAIPITTGSTTGINSVANENKIKDPARKTRIARSTAMKNLKDLMDGFQQDLKNQSQANKRQIQTFLSLIRDDFIKKIKDPVQIKDQHGGIQTDYTVILDSTAVNYPIDNRNMPFEQPEQNQNIKGITSFTLPISTTIMGAVNRILEMSTSISSDINNGFSYKTNIATMKGCDGKYTFTIIIKRFKTPKNEIAGINTGPGDGGKQVLEFEYGEGTKLDKDIIKLSMALATPYNISTLEEDAQEGGDAKIVMGDKEQITFERARDVKFSDTMMSGLRGSSNPLNLGLESASQAAIFDINNLQYVMSQTSVTMVTILGNSDLYYDLCRNPLDVINGKNNTTNENDSGAVLYKFPEFEPMYVKLTIRMKQDPTIKTPTLNDPAHFYYSGYYHLASVSNVINGSTFYQILRLLRTEDRY